MNLNFLHLSDLHFLNEVKLQSSMFGEIIAQSYPLASVLTKASQLKPYDFVVITGDLCHSGQREDYQALKTLLDKTFKVPVFVTLGNHDYKPAMFEVFKLESSQPFADLFWLYTFGDLVIIALNSASETHDDGQITVQAIKLLDETLENYRDRPMILMTHHHLDAQQFVMPACWFPSMLYDLLEKYDIRCILNGHTHHFYQSTLANIPYITAGSLSFVAENDKKELVFYSNPSAHLIHLNEQGVEVECCALEKAKYIKTVQKASLK